MGRPGFGMTIRSGVARLEPVYGLKFRGAMERAPVADFALDGAGVGGVGRGGDDSRMEVAVGALGLAERHLDVDAEGMAIEDARGRAFSIHARVRLPSRTWGASSWAAWPLRM